MPQDDDSEIDLGHLLRTLWRGKLWIALCMIAAVLIGGYYAFFVATPMYTTSATVTLESRQENVANLDSVLSGLSGDQASINTEVEILQSLGLIGKVVDKLKLTEDPEFNPRLRAEPQFSAGQAIAWVKGLIQPAPPQAPAPSPAEIRDATVDNVLAALSISNVRQSYVFRITAKTTAARKSALLANTVAELYILDQLEVKFDATQQATSWLTDRVAELQTQLEAAETAVKDFNASTNLVNAESLDAVNRQVKELRDRLANARVTLQAAEARVTALQAARDSGDRAAMAQAANDPTLTRLLNLDSGGDTFNTRYDQVISRARLEVSRAQSQIAALDTSLKELEAQIASQSGDLVKLQQLQREAEASRLIYEYFLGRLKETSVQQGIQQADSRVLSRAVVPRGPSEPRKSMILALAAVLGLMFGAGTVLAREMTQNTFRTAEDLERITGHTVMGQIPKIPARRRKRVLEYLASKPSSPAAEAIRNLRTSVLLSNVDSPPQVIMSTSSIPGEGKTTQSIALTQNLSGLGRKVLLVEGDIRRRVFSQYFDIADRPGILSVLSGEVPLEEAVIHEPTLRADVLIGEKSSTNAADVFSSNRFAEFLNQARETYDAIIIDTPPVLVVPDARVIGQSVDAILYSVKWDSTSKSQVIEGLRLFSTVNLRVTGLVLGQIDPTGMKRYGYGGRYGAYASYGKGYYEA